MNKGLKYLRNKKRPIKPVIDLSDKLSVQRAYQETNNSNQYSPQDKVKWLYKYI